MKISEIITDKYKLRMPPTVYYELLADVVEAEEEQEPSEDAVSRQAVLDIFGSKGEFDWVLNCAVEKIKELPPVTPTRPKAHWVYVDNCEELYDTYWCSNCHNEITVNAEKICDMVFVIEDMESCPKCGADMREGEA